MNQFSSTASSPGLLKKVYKGKVVSQTNDSAPMMEALRKKRDSLKRI